jgi:hypothetical protein
MPGMNYYDNTAPRGASYWSPPNENTGFAGGYAPGAVPTGAPTAGGDTNPEGAAADPFAYTQGSLLTPWQGHFSSSGYGGGYSVPEFTPFNYADFSYQAPSPGRFEENYADPAAFRFADFAGPSDFKAPTAEDMRADPGYQARMDAVKNAQVAGAAHGGVLRSGAFQKGLAQAVGNQASQEYGNVYNRRASEHDRLRQEATGNYQINQGNTKQAFDTNTANRLQGYQTRQGAWRDNANVALQEGQLGFQIAQGGWDRNFAKARQGYDDEQAYKQQVASAAASNAAQAYGRDLDDYNRSRDEFWTNQDRQYAILDREANRGMTAADREASAIERGYGAMGDYAVGGADAQAAGYQGSGNAWANFANTAGNAAGNAAMAGYFYGPNGPGAGGGGRGVGNLPPIPQLPPTGGRNISRNVPQVSNARFNPYGQNSPYGTGVRNSPYSGMFGN